MKRFFVTALLAATVLGALLYMTPRQLSSFEFGDCARAEICCRSTALPSVDAGCGFLVRCNVQQLQHVLNKCGGVDGVSVSFNGDERDVQKLLKRLWVKEYSRLQLNGVFVICGYSPRLTGGIHLDGKRVNVQIALRDGTVTVGSPLIFGSY